MAGAEDDPHGEGTMGSHPSQGVFVGYLGLGLIAFMAIFVIALFAGAASTGFN